MELLSSFTQGRDIENKKASTHQTPPRSLLNFCPLTDKPYKSYLTVENPRSEIVHVFKIPLGNLRERQQDFHNSSVHFFQLQNIT